MNPASREVMRETILTVLDANPTSRGLTAQAVRISAAGFGFAVELQSVEAELRYLQDKALVAIVDKLVSPENVVWRITAAGRDYLATR